MIQDSNQELQIHPESDPPVCLIAAKCCVFIYLVRVSHFAELHVVKISQ